MKITSTSLFLCFALVIFVIGIIVLQEEYSHRRARPFTKGFYENAVAGRIRIVPNEKQEVILRLKNSDSVYRFIPLPNTQLHKVHFLNVARTGDSLWKFSHSDSIYLMDRDQQVYSWKFARRDRYNTLYP